MKKILTVILAVIMVCGVFTACAKPAEEPSVAPTKITSETATPEPTPTETNTDPTDVSETTGLQGNTTYKPIMVQIDNADAARGYQEGLSMADIVYETDIDLSLIHISNLPTQGFIRINSAVGY